MPNIIIPHDTHQYPILLSLLILKVYLLMNTNNVLAHITSLQSFATHYWQYHCSSMDLIYDHKLLVCLFPNNYLTVFLIDSNENKIFFFCSKNV
jgi:hypothetical protein